MQRPLNTFGGGSAGMIVLWATWLAGPHPPISLLDCTSLHRHSHFWGAAWFEFSSDWPPLDSL